MKAMASTRSDQGARLKNSHHNRIASAQTIPPIPPKKMASGLNAGMTNLDKHNSTAAMTPGHSRSGFLAGTFILAPA
jgi:hypothetical protein